ncbi:MAG TPA: UvrD-helicase domain-containing protein [Termitinemataceae bacterium]|uniref:ATP-dependent helicase n=1 Tax=Treponema sp. J25 TaxID=2094121 RepID=UPI00104652EB|nr:UvrD-helicase domain-containing protein [Treponema sp. J25]TCW60958.1 AAA family ATPase [Treponema sp. J25]HOJ99926.1 UvrD-helicase domain-containing protein [Termitinemataceae bacterium]HOM23982.1 UvrD-helicase domain-containing protein [Termitinemataceae bacterium]HPQ01055.1 UvrD-helicase domain-containing protein [Termitinemataceae bacterium]
MEADYLMSLNAEQREAVLHQGAPLLILAGAGSGKTRVITTKIAYLIRECGIEPESILAVTFTNKAAREMAERAALIEPRAMGAMIRTFHSFGAWFLRRNGHLIGLDSRFVIYDEEDSLSLLATIMGGAPRLEVAHMAHKIARAKDYFLSPDDPALELFDHTPQFRRLYGEYEKRLATIGNVDFGDLIKKPVEILRRFPEVRQRFQDRIRVILVDEYQDSNVAQFELLKELCGPSTYLCVVGDDDQSIYRFRGAEVRNILEFPERFPNTHIIRLVRNYRSTRSILQVASAVVSHNRGRLGKEMVAERKEGSPPVVAFLLDQESEARFCADVIQTSVERGGARYGDWAILYRTNAQSLTFETELLHRRIPYRVVGSLKFYEREEVKDALAFLSFLMNPRDEIAFRRIVNKPARGIGDATIEKIIDRSFALPDERRGNLVESCRDMLQTLSGRTRKGLSFFLSVYDRITALFQDEVQGETNEKIPSQAEGPRAQESVPLDGEGPGGESSGRPSAQWMPPEGGEGSLKGGEGLSMVLVLLLEHSGLVAYHASQDAISGSQKVANLQELVNGATLYPATSEGLSLFLEHIELDRSLEATEDVQDAVTLITLHNTKGLEFPRVIITGLEKGVFPREDKNGDDLEEERRLFYVGITRAMDELYCTTCAMRRLYGKTLFLEPSPFLSEFPPESIRIRGNPPAQFPFGAPKGRLEGDPEVTGGYGRGPSVMVSRERPSSEQWSSDGRWKLGQRVFHDEYGYGEIYYIMESEAGPVVDVRFESGRKFRFMSRYQSSSIMRVDHDT